MVNYEIRDPDSTVSILNRYRRGNYSTMAGLVGGALVGGVGGGLLDGGLGGSVGASIGSVAGFYVGKKIRYLRGKKTIVTREPTDIELNTVMVEQPDLGEDERTSMAFREPIHTLRDNHHTVNPLAGDVIGSRKHGGPIDKTGKYLLHKGEYVVPKKEVKKVRKAIANKKLI
jgi:hypothetical protein